MATPDPRYLLCVCACATVHWPLPLIPAKSVDFLPVGLRKRLTVILVKTKILEHIWPEQRYHVVGNTEHWLLCPIFLGSSAVQGSQALKRMQRNYIITAVELLTVWKTTYQVGMRGSKSRYNSAVTTTNPKHTQPLVYYSAEPLDLRFILWQSDQPKMYRGRDLVTGSCLLTILVFACLCFFCNLNFMQMCVL